MTTARFESIAPVAMSFEQRLAAAYGAAGFKNRSQAAKALGISDSRMFNYANGRIPDADVLIRMARTFNTTVDYLLGIGLEKDAGLREMLYRLLELEGIDAHQADRIATVFLAAKELLDAELDEGSVEGQARMAARAAWQSQRPKD
jgi:transcriptional regulator with XRE-family HTH domain